MRAPTPLLLASALFVAGCAPSDSQDGAAHAPEHPAEASGPRVALAPTAPGVLPPAVLGQAGPLEGTEVPYVQGDSLTRGYLAVPEGPGPFPALVIVHEWNGLVDRIREIADDLAAEGYITLAVDLYQGKTGATPEENMALMQTAMADMPAIVGNLDAAVSYLKARSDVTGKVGAMGWCFGGGVALSYGLDGQHHQATAIFYGRLVNDPQLLAKMDHEVYGTFAALDAGIPSDEVRAFEAALQAAGVQNDVHIYDAVDHGFWLRVDEDPEIRSEPALDAWTRLKDYLKRTLG